MSMNGNRDRKPFRAGRLALCVLAAPAVIALIFAAAHAQSRPVGTAGEGGYKVILSDVNICVDDLGAIEKALADQSASRDGVQAARKIFEKVRLTAGRPEDPAAVPGVFAANLAAGPYLQNVTGSGVVIRWAAIQSDTIVRYGRGGQLTSTAPARRLPSPRWMSEAVLSGLESGVEYTYSIRVGGADVQGTFRTSPAGDAPFTFAVWGDRAATGRTSPKDPAAVTSEMARHTLDLALSVGDMMNEGLTDGDYYREFLQPAGGLMRNTPFFMAAGNHEVFGDPNLDRHHRFMRHPNDDRNYFAFTYAGCRYVVLDSNDAGLFAGAQLDWLKQELASDDCRQARFRFLLLHHSPWSSDWYGGEKNVQRVIVPLVEKAGVDIVFGGHFHCYERGARTTDGHQTWYVVTGGGGGEFTVPENNYPRGPQAWDFMTKHQYSLHFMHVSVDAAGLKARAIDEKGRTIDEFEILRPARGNASTLPARADARTPTPAAVPDVALVGSPPVAPLAADDRRTCTISPADRAAALAALQQCRKALAKENPDAAYRLALVAGVLEDARESAKEGTWSGPVERTVHLVPRLMCGGIRYRLKPSEKADASVRETLDKIANSQLNGTFEVKGLDLPMGPQRWILVDSITAK
jgi:hypothetical protein